MHPPVMNGVSPQQSIMQQLLMTTNVPNRNGSRTASTPGNTINEIAARTYRQVSANVNGLYSNGGSGSDADWMDASSFAISNNTPTMFLKCAECNLAKNSSEDLEVHIKQEHLNWLPFQCPICLSERASDAQMREHLHSSHRKNMNKFIYVDNVTAKRNLQILMDRSFTHAMNQNPARRSVPMMNGINRNAIAQQAIAQLNGLNSSQKERPESQLKDGVITLSGTPESSSPSRGNSPRLSATASVTRKRSHDSNGLSSNTDALLAQINAATSQASEEQYDDPSETLALIFGAKRVKSEFDDEEMKFNDSVDADYAAQDPSAFLDTLFANNPQMAFSDVSLLHPEDMNRSAASGGMPIKMKHVNPMAKKRVLGECSKCQKPVTAGARQMHMFYHLGKDRGIYRFRCKFEGCNVEHYRKDQMENHHSKVHGRIDPEMMEDRSLELYQTCQELSRELFVPSGTFCKPPQTLPANTSEDKDLSMELIGTNNCTPGPTAEKAQLVYNQQQAKSNIKKQEKQPKKDAEATWQNKAIPDDEHPLECMLCHKTMQNRIRGFHILWHLAKDLGINRYACKFCDFGHDRSQSVQTHGKREHGTEENVMDRIDEYQPEIEDMSNKCFGFKALFSQESRRRSKIPLAPVRDDELDDKAESPEEDDEEMEDADINEAETSDDKKAESEDIEPEVEEEQEQQQDAEENEDDYEDEMEIQKTPSLKTNSARRSTKSSKNRRFGSRKPASKSKRLEMTRLREISMKLGGAQYLKKKSNEAAHCGLCGVLQHSRMSEHAYKHMTEPLFVCPHCDLGNYSRDTVVKHMKEMHEDRGGQAIDQRLKFAQEIKNKIHECYPLFFVDAPIPTSADIEKLKALNGTDIKNIAQAGDETDNDVEDESVVDEHEEQDFEEKKDDEEEFENEM